MLQKQIQHILQAKIYINVLNTLPSTPAGGAMSQFKRDSDKNSHDFYLLNLCFYVVFYVSETSVRETLCLQSF